MHRHSQAINLQSTVFAHFWALSWRCAMEVVVIAMLAGFIVLPYL